MKIIYARRRGGKTTKAVKLAKKTGAILVVMNERWKRCIHDQYKLPLNQMVTFSSVKDRFAIEGLDKPFILDDADHFLRLFFPSWQSLIACTMSKPFTKADCKKFGLPLDMVGRT